MSGDILIDPVDPGLDPEAELDRLADLYLTASGTGLRVLSALGSSAEDMLNRLPGDVRSGLTRATEAALHAALRVADGSRRLVSDQPEWINTTAATAMGAAGGAGGVSSSLIELPATTAMFLRTIQGVAAQQGFDPSSPGVRFDSVRVFASSGPLRSDDGADLAFLSLRLTLTGPALQRLIAQVAPRFARVLGQKLAAQTVPVLGAAAGAGTNLIYARYYQRIAQVQFGLRRLAIDSGIPEAELIDALSLRMLNRRQTPANS